MLIIALVLALIGLVALVFAVVTSNELVAWVCIGASVLGVVLLIVDAIRERQQRGVGADDAAQDDAAGDEDSYVDYPEEDSDEGEDADKDAGEPAEDADAAEESAVSAEAHRDDKTN
jgi:hypothetical protein